MSNTILSIEKVTKEGEETSKLTGEVNYLKKIIKMIIWPSFFWYQNKQTHEIILLKIKNMGEVLDSLSK